MNDAVLVMNGLAIGGTVNNASALGYTETIGTACKNPSGYQVGDYFMGDNGLYYKATAAIVTGATITIGTNCVQTSVSEALQNTTAGPLPSYTLAEYLALPEGSRPEYWIQTDENYAAFPASQITYDNSSSTSLPSNVQGAITKLNADIAGLITTENITVTFASGRSSRVTSLADKVLISAELLGNALIVGADVDGGQKVGYSFMALNSSASVDTSVSGSKTVKVTYIS